MFYRLMEERNEREYLRNPCFYTQKRLNRTRFKKNKFLSQVIPFKQEIEIKNYKYNGHTLYVDYARHFGFIGKYDFEKNAIEESVHEYKIEIGEDELRWHLYLGTIDDKLTDHANLNEAQDILNQLKTFHRQQLRCGSREDFPVDQGIPYF